MAVRIAIGFTWEDSNCKYSCMYKLFGMAFWNYDLSLNGDWHAFYLSDITSAGSLVVHDLAKLAGVSRWLRPKNSVMCVYYYCRTREGEKTLLNLICFTDQVTQYIEALNYLIHFETKQLTPLLLSDTFWNNVMDSKIIVGYHAISRGQQGSFG